MVSSAGTVGRKTSDRAKLFRPPSPLQLKKIRARTPAETGKALMEVDPKSHPSNHSSARQKPGGMEPGRHFRVGCSVLATVVRKDANSTRIATVGTAILRCLNLIWGLNTIKTKQCRGIWVDGMIGRGQGLKRKPGEPYWPPLFKSHTFRYGVLVL